MSRCPRVAVTPGEPAGVGPEILAAVVRRAWPCELVAVADPALLGERATAVGLPLLTEPFDPARPPCPHTPGAALPVLAVPLAVPARAGRLDPRNAGYVLETLRQAVRGCLTGIFQALVTGPVHKGVINDAGLPFRGHTELLAELSGVGPVVMLLAAPGLRVALVTTHLPLARVSAAITPGHLEGVCRVLERGLRERLGIARPRVLVCGLNPHAGEGSHLGREEVEVIEPVLTRLRAQGMDLVGPVPADTAFAPARLAGFDAVLAMYHDQGLPVIKREGFGRTVNVTLGLPFVRTSVDHGTALELAGTGQADPGSLEAALRLALEQIDRRP
jgi:4-hydroxythreonine-4-phosphate dehydrogenase